MGHGKLSSPLWSLNNWHTLTATPPPSPPKFGTVRSLSIRFGTFQITRLINLITAFFPQSFFYFSFINCSFFQFFGGPKTFSLPGIGERYSLILIEIRVSKFFNKTLNAIVLKRLIVFLSERRVRHSKRLISVAQIFDCIVIQFTHSVHTDHWYLLLRFTVCLWKIDEATLATFFIWIHSLKFLTPRDALEFVLRYIVL